MADKEHDIPVKVVDRRWWANAADASATEAPSRDIKPSYVEAARTAGRRERQPGHRNTSRSTARRRPSSRRRVYGCVVRCPRTWSVDAGRSSSDLLEVVDNLDRAIESARQGASPASLLQGVEMVRRQFLAKLEGLGVTRIEVADQPFDPSVHEAITTVPSTSPDQDGHIVGVVRQGTASAMTCCGPRRWRWPKRDACRPGP